MQELKKRTVYDYDHDFPASPGYSRVYQVVFTGFFFGLVSRRGEKDGDMEDEGGRGGGTLERAVGYGKELMNCDILPTRCCLSNRVVRSFYACGDEVPVGTFDEVGQKLEMDDRVIQTGTYKYAGRVL